MRAAVLADGPVYRRRRMRDTVISGLDEARSSVLLVSPYFAPGRGVLDALARAAERDVQVEILMAGRSDHPIFRRAARAFVPRLLRSGVRVFEDTERMMHAKVVAFDAQLSIIGTSNLDRQSLYHSYEVSLLIEGHATADWIRRHFGPGPTNALPIDIDALAERGWLARLVDHAAWSLVRLI
jgi:cardiolipin synthase